MVSNGDGMRIVDLEGTKALSEKVLASLDDSDGHTIDVHAAAVVSARVLTLLAEVESLRRQVAEADGAIVQLVRRVEAMDELFRRAQEWREMRRGSPTKPKPESAALISAVDALSQPVATKETD